MTVLLAIGIGLCSLRVPAPADGGMSSNAVGMLLRLPDAPPTFWQQKENGNKMEKTTKLQKFRGVILNNISLCFYAIIQKFQREYIIYLGHKQNRTSQ